MGTFVKGNAVTNATSYDLFEKNDGNLIDFANPSNVPSSGCWTWDSANNQWVCLNSNAENIRWEFNLTAGMTIVWTFDIEVDEGSSSIYATVRNSSNAVKASGYLTKNTTEYTLSYTAEEDGTHSVRLGGATATNSARVSNMSVREEGVELGYSLLATASEINFEVSALGLEAGDHTLVVKAKADGYEDSDYSNEVVYTAT